MGIKIIKAPASNHTVALERILKRLETEVRHDTRESVQHAAAMEVAAVKWAIQKAKEEP